MGRIIRTDADCADCLCRVCARNECNDSWNPLVKYKTCDCNCVRGVHRIMESEEDCPDFLPDEDER